MYLKILILAVLQGACELLPVSSSAHVIIAEKIMGLDPSAPDMTLLLVMLHTGTMFAVILYFWRSWRERFFSSRTSFIRSLKLVASATILTGIVGFTLKLLIEKVVLSDIPNAEVEHLFSNLGLVAISLAAVGLLIVYSGWRTSKTVAKAELSLLESAVIGAVQGVCLPFRGFSRSGATISTGLLLGIDRLRSEEFSFSLAVILTPPVVLREVLRLLKAHSAGAAGSLELFHLFLPSLAGMILSFIAGLLALKWLSRWLEKGRWSFFGYYCLLLSIVVTFLWRIGI